MKKTVRKGYVVAIDGPSGAGKSTVSRLLAEALRGVLLDTGAMYRGVALLAMESGLSTPFEWARLAARIHFDISPSSHTLLIDKTDFGERLRGEHVGRMASSISRCPALRGVLTGCQRRLVHKVSRGRPVVVEGRDIGTVVFPRAPFKFFVTAEPRVRAQRRFEQLKRNGVKGLTLRAVMIELSRRDKQDTQRKVAPLRRPKDAVVVDTSKTSIPQVVLFLKTHIESQLRKD